MTNTNQPRKVLSLSGGGVRVYGAFGALLEAESQGIDIHQFDIITATSAGAIVAVLIAAGKTAEEMVDIALEMPLNKFIDKGLVGEKIIWGGLNNQGLADWIDSLNAPPSEKIFINTLNKKTNKQKIFTKKDYEERGYGYAVKCSTRLPFAMKPVDDTYIDGGVVENPLMLHLNSDDQILCLRLGYAGEIREGKSFINRISKFIDPLSRYEDMVYAFDFKSHMQFKNMVDKFNNIDIINPEVYDIRSSNFWITDEQKLSMIERGRLNTRDHWKKIKHKWS